LYENRYRQNSRGIKYRNGNASGKQNVANPKTTNSSKHNKGKGLEFIRKVFRFNGLTNVEESLEISKGSPNGNIGKIVGQKQNTKVNESQL
jgi:hypothetical protein